MIGNDRFIDDNKAHGVCVQAQRYYRANEIATQVLPASLTSISEVMALAGVDHITVSPPLLRELSSTSAATWAATWDEPSLFDTGEPGKQDKTGNYWEKWFGDDEKKYRLAFTRSGGGEAERKLVQAINIFCDFQDRLEGMMI